uniref:Uncharacterized protein n=1 Tax=viral metagenome TaxID=1070528 RepID=A0A6C0BYE7_9ZZZZ
MLKSILVGMGRTANIVCATYATMWGAWGGTIIYTKLIMFLKEKHSMQKHSIQKHSIQITAKGIGISALIGGVSTVNIYLKLLNALAKS